MDQTWASAWVSTNQRKAVARKREKEKYRAPNTRTHTKKNNNRK
jgi:hypothetical protein